MDEAVCTLLLLLSGEPEEKQKQIRSDNVRASYNSYGKPCISLCEKLALSCNSFSSTTNQE